MRPGFNAGALRLELVQHRVDPCPCDWSKVYWKLVERRFPDCFNFERPAGRIANVPDNDDGHEVTPSMRTLLELRSKLDFPVGSHADFLAKFAKRCIDGAFTSLSAAAR
jgi:hypothetical protein